MTKRYTVLPRLKARVFISQHRIYNRHNMRTGRLIEDTWYVYTYRFNSLFLEAMAFSNNHFLIGEAAAPLMTWRQTSILHWGGARML